VTAQQAIDAMWDLINMGCAGSVLLEGFLKVLTDYEEAVAFEVSEIPVEPLVEGADGV